MNKKAPASPGAARSSRLAFFLHTLLFCSHCEATAIEESRTCVYLFDCGSAWTLSGRRVSSHFARVNARARAQSRSPREELTINGAPPRNATSDVFFCCSLSPPLPRWLRFTRPILLLIKGTGKKEGERRRVERREHVSIALRWLS